MADNFPLQQTLEAIGLSPKEASVYLALLELGRDTASHIARKAQINRSTAYVILDSLVNKDMVRITGKEPKQEYVAESPAKILAWLETQVQKNQAGLKQAQAILPQLTSMHNVKNRPIIRFYEGQKGLIEVYEDTLTAHEEIRGYGGVDDMRKALPEYFKTYMNRRANKNIGIRAIFADTPKARELARFDQAQKRQTALVPADKYYFSPEINVYDNKIMIASWREQLGVTIESAEIADAMKKIFELAWAQAKQLSRK